MKHRVEVCDSFWWETYLLCAKTCQSNGTLKKKGPLCVNHFVLSEEADGYDIMQP